MNKINIKETEEELDKIRHSAKYNKWRKSVLERDDYTCQKCGAKNTILHAHHLKDFHTHPKLRFEINNGQTLCISCHIKEDNLDGVRKYYSYKKSKFSKPQSMPNKYYEDLKKAHTLNRIYFFEELEKHYKRYRSKLSGIHLNKINKLKSRLVCPKK